MFRDRRDHAARACPSCLSCLADRGVGGHAGGDVADRNADPARRFRRARHRGEAAFALHQKIIGLGVAHRAVFAISADVAGDEARKPFAKRRRIKPQLCQRAGQEILDEDIGARQHVQKDLAVPVVLDVQRDRFLAPVQPGEIGALAVHGRIVSARKVAAALSFYLYHARPRIRQPRRAERGRHRLLERDDERAGERALS